MDGVSSLTPGTAEELASVQAQVIGAIPPAPEPQPAPSADDDSPDALLGEVEKIAKDPSILADMSEEEIALVAELLFGLVSDWRGPEWEMPAESKAARRIAAWARKSIERHGGVP